MKKFFKIALTFFLSASIFFGCSYFYLYNSLKKTEKAAEKKQENIPYYETPVSCGLHFLLPAGKEILIFLDFEERIAYIIDINKNAVAEEGYAGYGFDYDFHVDYAVLSALIDRLGGIDLTVNNEPLRFTGVQVCDALCKNTSPEFPFETVFAVCERISQNGFSSDDFVFLIENSETTLTVPVCIYWQDYIKDMFADAVFVNWVN
ncbi:MAG: hypothetical protein J5662_08405 [Clostridia bacterium]|nr:hypothetical protein [Clostridia bacterium]